MMFFWLCLFPVAICLVDLRKECPAPHTRTSLHTDGWCRWKCWKPISVLNPYSKKMVLTFPCPNDECGCGLAAATKAPTTNSPTAAPTPASHKQWTKLITKQRKRCGYGHWLDVSYDAKFVNAPPILACIACPAGYYSGQSEATGSCTICPAGQYGSKASTTAKCSGACLPGRWGKQGAISNQCTGACKAGTAGGGGVKLSCHTCEAGSFSTEGSAKCKYCYRSIHGEMYQPYPGQPSCSQCPRGKTSSETRHPLFGTNKDLGRALHHHPRQHQQLDGRATSFAMKL